MREQVDAVGYIYSGVGSNCGLGGPKCIGKMIQNNINPVNNNAINKDKYTNVNNVSNLLFQSMDYNCGEWVECMGVASGCGEQEVGVASGSGWNLWVWLLGEVLRRYIDFLILLIPTPLVSVLFCSSIPTFLFIF